MADDRAARREERAAGAWWPAAAVVAIGLAAKLALLALVLRPAGGLAGLEFGFGEYARTLVEHGRFAECVQASCARSSRMPLLPVFYAALWSAGARSLMAIAVAKAVLMALLLLPCIAYYLAALPPRGRLRPMAAALLLAVFLSPYYLRTAADVQAEEAILCDLLLALGFLLLAMCHRRAGGASGGTRAAVAVTALASALFLLKSSMILAAGIAVLAAAVLSGSRGRVLAAAGMAAAFAAVVGGWSLRNLQASGRFSPGTSYEGANLYRGWNPLTSRFYPEVSLDRLMNSRTVQMADGSVVHPPPLPRRNAFADEWAWNDHYRSRAVEWARAEPAALAAVTGEKARVFLAEVRAYPISTDTVFTPRAYPGVMMRAGEAWMVLGRLAQLLIVPLLLVLWRRTERRRWLAWIPAALLAAYALPYLVGFAYQRHLTPWVCLLMVYALDLAWQVLIARRASPATLHPAVSA